MPEYDINAIVENCKKLEQLFASKISVDNISKTLQNCPNITHLSLDNSNINDDELLQLIQKYPRLQVLNLYGNMNITDKSIIELALKCTQISFLNLSWCYHISDESIIAIATHSKKLVYLELNNTAITDVSVNALMENCSTLKVLSFHYCSKLSESIISKLRDKYYNTRIADLQWDCVLHGLSTKNINYKSIIK